MNVNQIKLQKIINECDKHILRMDSAYKKSAGILPLTKDKYVNLSEDDIEHIDQYLFRFAKLQDTMGQRLFKVIFLLLEEDSEELSFIDMLNRLEKLTLLESTAQWLELRKIRNTLSHTYEDETEEMSVAINTIFNKKHSIEKIYNRLIASSRSQEVATVKL
ncbi:MAG: hypothetical protein KAT04_03230 [Methylococcales bacterium]|nr:hypothetical protein [Methylococcales bacterium]